MCEIGQLTQKEIAELLGVTPRTIRDWHAAGLPRNADGTYCGPEIVSWIRQRDSGGELDLSAERARLAKWQADKTEQDVELRAGRMLLAEDVESWVGSMITTARAHLLAIEGSVAAEVPREQAHAVATVVRRHVHRALHEMAQRAQDGCAGLGADAADA